MKVKALTNIKCTDGWHNAGEVFEIHGDALGDLKDLVEKTEESVSPRTPDMNLPGDERVAQEEKPKRTAARRRKE